MRKSRFTEAQIVDIVREYDAGVPFLRGGPSSYVSRAPQLPRTNRYHGVIVNGTLRCSVPETANRYAKARRNAEPTSGASKP